jgi:micrococcal nuclease
MFAEIIALILSLFSLLFGGVGGQAVSDNREVTLPSATTTALVLNVVDGDTIEVDLGDGSGSTRVRYIGIDTPEPYSKGAPECGSKEATARNRELVVGKTVTLIPGQESIDQYGRLLAYVYVGDVFVNRTMVDEGFAEVMMFSPNDTYKQEFDSLVETAQRDERGIWDDC